MRQYLDQLDDDWEPMCGRAVQDASEANREIEMATDKGEKHWRPVDPKRHHREGGWDYRGRAIYHFTLPVEGRYPLFGTLEGESAETAFVRLNAFGRRVCQMLSGLAQFYRGKGYELKVLAQMVMPDHVHLVIQVLEPLPQSIGAVVRGFKSGCTKVYKEEFYYSGENAAGVHGEVPASAAGVQVDVLVQFARIFAGRGSIWQPDKAYYHERILHAPGQLRRMIDYVKDNPRRLWLKRQNPDLFRMHRETVLWGLPFTSMGNHFLLEWPDRQLVEISRSADSATIDGRRNEVLAAAHNGAVTYTAAISDGERLIARAVREQGFPLVVLLADGFPEEGAPHEKYYKPGGVYFDACSKGHLLLLEPKESAYEAPAIVAAAEDSLHKKAEARHCSYEALPHDAKRYRFVALNEIGRLLVTQGSL